MLLLRDTSNGEEDNGIPAEYKSADDSSEAEDSDQESGEERLVVATLVVGCDSYEVDEEAGSSSLAATVVVADSLSCSATTATTLATSAVVLEAKKVSFSNKVEDVLRHKRGKCCIAIFLLCVLAIVGGIIFFSLDKPHDNQTTTTRAALPPADQPQSPIGQTQAPSDTQPEIGWEEAEGESELPSLPITVAPTTRQPTPSPTPAPTSPLEGYVVSLLPLASTREALMDEQSPQSKALAWLLKDLSEFNVGATSTSVTLRNDNNTASSYSLPYSESRLIQRYALATFYYATRGVGWRFQQFWLSSWKDSHECEWYSSHERRSQGPPPVCSTNGDYNRLVLVENILRGTLPPELGLLTRLELLKLQGDNFFGKEDEFLAGSLPSEIGLLVHLDQLDVSKNGLVGTLPTELGHLTRMDTLRLMENQLTGPIPSQLLGSNCSPSMELNEEGEIAASCPSMNLREIRMYDNQISGTLPTSWNRVSSSLKTLDWGFNRFTGTVPPEMSQLTTLENLDVQGNLLTGTIPTELATFPDLKFLKLNDNVLTGSIPTILGELGSPLQWLLLKNNRLTGTIPSELGQLMGITWLLLEGNRLSGTIPTELGLFNLIRFLRLSENKLVGSVPDEVCDLQSRNWWFYSIEVDCAPVSCGCRVCVCS